MTEQVPIKIIIVLQDQELDDANLQEFTEILCQQITEVDGVDQANLVAVETPPEGSRALGGFLLGILTAEVNPVNIKTLFIFLSDRLGGKTIKMSIEAPDGRKLNVEASSQEEFEFAVQQAKNFIDKV
ncbi:sugar ABC transporter permease [Microcoleus sp. CAWBG58]|uniref:sugar ABC transporter permease n=1 Tax=Microcoleus sp. CAWBG58 TaxID=2841651 RepID=UPI0025CC9063|nr:sugar ABC transporter permease [Microcoleus sp. CAWBG58]